MVLLQVIVGIVVTYVALMVLVFLLGSRVGAVELMVLMVPAVLAGVWASRRVSTRWRSTRADDRTSASSR